MTLSLLAVYTPRTEHTSQSKDFIYDSCQSTLNTILSRTAVFIAGDLNVKTGDDETEFF